MEALPNSTIIGVYNSVPEEGKISYNLILKRCTNNFLKHQTLFELMNVKVPIMFPLCDMQ